MDMESTPKPGSDRGDELTTRPHGRAPAPMHGSLVGDWLRRNHARISASGGALLLFLALVIPIITPVEQRGEVLIMTVLFGLAGAFMLYSAATTAGSTTDASQHTQSTTRPVRQSAARPTSELVAARKALLEYQARRNRGRALAGLGFGLLFTLAGVVAPFILNEGNANPDARFLMMIGFSPVAISGGLMVLVFGRMVRAMLPHQATTDDHLQQHHVNEGRSDSIASTLATVSIVSGLVLTGCAIVLPFLANDVMRTDSATASILMGGLGLVLSLSGGWVKRREMSKMANTAGATRTSTRRAPVPRVPGGILYRVVVPAAIVLTVLLIIAVILVIVAATVTPLVR